MLIHVKTVHVYELEEEKIQNASAWELDLEWGNTFIQVL